MNKKEKMGKMARMMEMHSGKIPMACICAAGLLAVASITLKCMHKKHGALTAGQFVAPLMLMGMYKKMEKMEGRGRHHKHHHKHGHGECW